MQVLPIHFKNNHYPTDVKMIRNEVYYLLKWRNKFTLLDIWHETYACMCQISIFSDILSLGLFENLATGQLG